MVDLATGTDALEDERMAASRRRALTFATAQAIVGACAPIAIGTGGIIGSTLLGADKSLATAPVTAFNVGVAIGAFPAAWLMSRLGRRLGFISGTVVTAFGGIVGALAIISGNFWLFASALMLLGLGGAFVQQYRFAATDGAPLSFRPKAISWVLAGGMFAAVIGPQTVILTRELTAPFTFAASYGSIVILAALGALVLSFVRTAPGAGPRAAAETGKEGRALSEIVLQTRFVVGLVCAVGSYALMSFVMTGAPLAMVGAGCTHDEALLGISWHVMAMFAPSFFTGNLIGRFGKATVVGAGLAILGLSAVVGLAGDTLWHFWISLILLGIGWNFGFIGSTAIVADTYRPEEKARTEGVHDLILFTCVALASLMSGFIYNLAGWVMLNLIVFPVIVLCGLLLIYGKWHHGRVFAA